MVKISLSSPAARAASVLSAVVLVGVCLVWLVLAPSWLPVLALVLLLAAFAFTLPPMLRSSLLVRTESRAVQLTGFQKKTIDCSSARTVYTRPHQIGQQTTRAIVVEDADGTELAAITALITANSGNSCEVIARRLAQALEVEFRPTVPPHLYDRKAKMEYERSQKEQKRSRSKARSTSGPAPEPPPPAVNYDEMDDE